MHVNRILGACAGLAMTLATLPAFGHHATSTYYLEEPVPLSGTIVEVIWANPHGVIVLQDAEGAYWVGEMAAILSLSQQGLSPDLLPVGMPIDVNALPSRDGTNRIHIEEIIVEGESIYGTPD